ncbi:MAG TPA: hypothetical protein VEK56_01800 [Vicinamibacterales bacterium]|nr:hypothetical protein [Vicinamibacterales bacterium]
MMKAIGGSALGGLAAGLLALVASAQGRPAPADPWAMQAANAPRAMTVADTRAASTATTNAPTMVQCEPQQEAVLRRSVVAGREVAEVTCISTRGGYGDAAYLDGRSNYSQSDIVTQPAARPRVVRQVVSTQPRSYSRQSVERSSGRSWKKTALIIGGSTAAGAGIGGLAGGKKGALIGAAIGGGASTIYEATKRH